MAPSEHSSRCWLNDALGAEAGEQGRNAGSCEIPGARAGRDAEPSLAELGHGQQWAPYTKTGPIARDGEPEVVLDHGTHLRATPAEIVSEQQVIARLRGR
jgi:hypothetical protein